MSVSSLASHLLGAETCVCCGAATADVPLCAECLSERVMKYTPFSEARCRLCGRELVSEQGVCVECARRPCLRHVRRLFPIHAYRMWKKDLLFLWKMQDRRLLSPVFSRLAADAISSVPELRGLPLVPVPPRPGKIKSRGWDQVQELCRLLRRRHGLAVLDILRRRTAEQQKHLDRGRRQAFAEQSYFLAEGFRKRFPAAPKKLVLVDDIATTGATLDSCAGVLRSAGVEQVYALALFYA